MNCEQIQQIIADRFNIRVDDLKGLSRLDEHVVPRQIAMFVVRKYLHFNLKRIGTVFNRHHTTVMYSIAAIQNRVETDSSFRHLVSDVIGRIVREYDLEGEKMRRKVITLCGSIKFEELFHFFNKKFTLEGYVVFSCGIFIPLEDGVEIKRMLEDIHFQKIDLSNEIFVINKDGYVGNSTQKEIEYAKRTGKKVKYFEDTDNEHP